MGRSAHEPPTFAAHHEPRRQILPDVTSVDEEEDAVILSDNYALTSQPLASPSDSVLLTPSPRPDAVGGLDAGILSTMPGDVVRQPLFSPRDHETNAQQPAHAAIGGALAVTPATLPPTAPPAAKEGPGGLRLPSFQQLGIAVPHPDHLVSPVFRDEPPLLPDFAGLDVGSSNASEPSPTKSDGGRAVQSPVYHYVNPLTPPTESGTIAWNTQPAVQTAGMHSPPALAGHEADQADDAAAAGDAGVVAPAAPEQEEATGSECAGSGEQRSWIDDAVDALLQNLRTTSRPSASFRVLSHALPSTSTTGHIFSEIVNALHESTSASPITPMTWINVFHAIPGRFNLADLPSSPPSTPGPAVGGEDYFTQKTFDSAVSILDYQIASPMLPRSPRPIVPPASIDVSIVERYIPPSTAHEFAEMFDPNGSSILVDRLVELSPENGSLLFIYPTKAGATTFMRDYLGPVLDPLLRSMSVVDGLSADMCRNIGTMTAVPSMLTHSALHREITALCTNLSRQESSAQRFHLGGHRPQFSVSYSASRHVHFARGVWAREWWTKQEKLRIKEILAHHYSRESRRSSLKEFGAPATTGIVLLQTLLEGVVGKEALEREVPAGDGIEVGVFVIKRSLEY